MNTSPAEKYIALRYTEPFADPFDRIPKGWQIIVKNNKENDLKGDWCTSGSCLEEVKEINGVCCKDVMVFNLEYEFE